MTPTGPEVGAGHLTPAKTEVAHPVPSLNPAGTIMARGLMSLMGTTCVGLGGSRVWQEESLAHRGGHVTPAELEVGTGQLTSADPKMWAVHVTPSELEVLPGNVTPTEMEVRGQDP